MTKSDLLSTANSAWNLAEPHETILVIRAATPEGRLIAAILESRVDECSLGSDLVPCKQILRDFIDGQN